MSKYDWGGFYDKNDEYCFKQNAYFEILKALNKRFTACLDLGCGKGRHLAMLSSISDEVYGLDIIEYDSKNYKEFIVEDARTYNYGEINFDFIFSNGLLHHFSKNEVFDIINEISKCVKHNSVFIFNLHSKEDYKFGKGVNITTDEFVFHEGKEKGQLHSFWEQEEIIQMINKCNFKMIKMLHKSQNGYACWYCLASRNQPPLLINEN